MGGGTDERDGSVPRRPRAGLGRRQFLKRSLAPAAALPLWAEWNRRSGSASDEAPAPEAAAGPEDVDRGPPDLVDTNVHLFSWPFRSLKYADPAALVTKLRSHRVRQAWAGSFEALLHKDLDAVNARLAHACRRYGDGFLLPFGTVNPLWPDWQEDLRRCHERWRMPGLRLYPAYHNYRLDQPPFARLLEAATDRGMLVQVALHVEDARVHHPVKVLPDVTFDPLIELLQPLPHARVQLLNWARDLGGQRLPRMVEQTTVRFDISHLEGVGAVGLAIEGDHWHLRGSIPGQRLLFGSHAPYFPVENALMKLFESPLRRAPLDAIMRRNAETFLAARST